MVIKKLMSSIWLGVRWDFTSAKQLAKYYYLLPSYFGEELKQRISGEACLFPAPPAAPSLTVSLRPHGSF